MKKKTVTILVSSAAVTIAALVCAKIVGSRQYKVKGKDFTGIYYTPDDMFYDNIIPDILFKNEEEAIEYGYRPSNVPRGKK